MEEVIASIVDKTIAEFKDLDRCNEIIIDKLLESFSEEKIGEAMLIASLKMESKRWLLESS